MEPDIDRLISDFPDLSAEQVREHVADAMAHKAHSKWHDMTRYCRNWIRRGLAGPTHRVTKPLSAKSAAALLRTADYGTWASKAGRK